MNSESIKDRSELKHFLLKSGFSNKITNTFIRTTCYDVDKYDYMHCKLLANVKFPINEYEYMKLLNGMCFTKELLKIRGLGKDSLKIVESKTQEYLDNHQLNICEKITKELKNYTTLELIEEIKKRII